MSAVRDGSGASQIGAVHVREAGGTAEVAFVRVRDSSGLHVVYTIGDEGDYSVVAIPLTPFGGAASAGDPAVTTELVTVTAEGGVSPYTFAFTQIDTGAGWTISVVGPGQARFTRGGVSPEDTYSATFKCTVTDAAGRKVDTPTITATVTNYGGRTAPWLI